MDMCKVTSTLFTLNAPSTPPQEVDRLECSHFTLNTPFTQNMHEKNGNLEHSKHSECLECLKRMDPKRGGVRTLMAKNAIKTV